MRSWQNESVLKAGGVLDDCEVLARFLGDRNGQSRDAFLIDQAAQQLSERSADRIQGSNIGAEPLHHSRGIDAAAARIAAAVGATKLVKRLNSLHRNGKIDRWIDCERDNIRHTQSRLSERRSKRSAIPNAALRAYSQANATSSIPIRPSPRQRQYKTRISRLRARTAAVCLGVLVIGERASFDGGAALRNQELQRMPHLYFIEEFARWIGAVFPL